MKNLTDQMREMINMVVSESDNFEPGHIQLPDMTVTFTDDEVLRLESLIVKFAVGHPDMDDNILRSIMKKLRIV